MFSFLYLDDFFFFFLLLPPLGAVEAAAFAAAAVIVVVLAHNRAPFNIIWNCIGIDYKILAHWKKMVIYR